MAKAVPDKISWDYVMHLPRGSADGNWIVVDAASDDTGDVIAIVDPNDICLDLAEEHAALLAAAPAMRAALALIANPDKAKSVEGLMDIARAALAAAKPYNRDVAP